VDDWIAVTRGGDEVAELFGSGNAEEQRFRPSWTVWNYLEWHTFDAPDGIAGPNAWNLARLAILVAGLTLIVALALPLPRGRLEAVAHGVVAAVPAFLVVTVPKFARDLARFGTQEPLLVGGMALGGSLLVLGARALLRPDPVPRVRVAALLLAGSVLWLAGVYQKETSLAVLPLLAAALLAGWSRLRGWRSLSTARQRGLLIVAVVAALPLVHVALESARITLRGDLVYGAEVAGGQGIVDGLELLWDWSTEVFSLTARRVVLAALVLTVLVAAIRRRLDWIALGALATGALTLVLAAQSGVAVSRYYLPAYALAGVALALSLARLPAVVQVLGVAALAFAFLPASEARTEVEAWSQEEQAGGELVHLLAGLHGGGCYIAMAGIDQETSLALGALVARANGAPAARCASDDVYLVLRPYGDGAVLAQACAPGALTPAAEPFPLEGGAVEVHRCPRLGERPVRDPTLGLVAPAELVAAKRFRPET
jgi:hypothetical protein